MPVEHRHRHLAWMVEYQARRNFQVVACCGGATAKMCDAFPELRRVRGYVYFPDGFSEQHWWCETPSGKIVDPTVDQFEKYGGVLRYEEYDESIHGPLPIGKCMNCGLYVYEGEYDEGGSSVCSKECEEQLRADFM